VEIVFLMVGLVIGAMAVGVVAGSMIDEVNSDKEYLLDLLQQYNGGQEIPHRDQWAWKAFREARKEFKA